jgi:hypothetical protein
MHRIGITAIAAALLVAGSIAPAEASSSGTSYKEGPSNGDASTFHKVDTGTGEIIIFQHNTRQAGTVHCSGEGPRATLLSEQPA